MADRSDHPTSQDGDEINQSDDQDPAGAIDWEALSPVPVRLPASVAAQIEEMVASGRLRHGRQLPSERRLAELLGVSRGSVREAITELEVKGLVTRRAGSGTHIQVPAHSLFTGPIVSGFDLSDRETTELLDLREAVEPGIAARAAERATEADVEEIRGLASAFRSGRGRCRATDRAGRPVPSGDRPGNPQRSPGRAGRALHARARRDAAQVCAE